jgi:L-lactate dehydrogenase complex protein LldE
VLERLGHQVVFPEEQTCCGQMHVNTGYQREALPLISRYVDTFEPHELIVAPSGSCVGSITHQHAMVARRLGDELLAVRAGAVAAHVRAVAATGRRARRQDVGAPCPHRLTYHRTCHSLRMLRVGDRPLRAAARIRYRSGSVACGGRLLRLWRLASTEGAGSIVGAGRCLDQLEASVIARGGTVHWQA